MKLRNLFLISILLFLSLGYKLLKVNPPDFTFFLLCAIVTFFCVLIFISHSQKGVMKKHWLKPSYIFILSYLIVSYQYLIDYWFGYKTGFRFSFVVNHCIVLETIGLLAFSLGYCWNSLSYRGRKVINSNDVVVRAPVFLIILQAIILLVYLSTINIRQTLSGEAYSLGYTNTASAYSELLFFSVNVAIIYRRIIGRHENITFWQYLKSFNPIFWLLFMFYIILKFISGDRGPMIYNVLLIFFGFIYVSERKIKVVWVISALLVSATVLSVLGITRQTKVGEASFTERYRESSANYSEYGRFGELSEPTILPATEELAGSFGVTLAGVNAIVNDKIEYNNGIYLFVNVLNIIPFFSSFSAPYLSSVNSSSTAFANKYLGVTGYSVGTTLISDLYLDLGLIWVLIGMLIIGLFFYRVDYVICSGDNSFKKILVVISLCYASCAISIPRSTFFTPVKYIVWACIILYLDRSFDHSRKNQLKQINT